MLLNICIWSIVVNYWPIIYQMFLISSVHGDEEDSKSDRLSKKFKGPKRDRPIGSECILSSDCRQSPHLSCFDSVCSCEYGYSPSFNNTCISDSDSDDWSTKLMSYKMLLIMLVMAIMFVGMCVALNLFSRARFQNQRTVLSNPRVLQLAKAERHRHSSPITEESDRFKPYNHHHQFNHDTHSPSHSYCSYHSPIQSHNNGKKCMHTLEPNRTPNRSRTNSTSSIHMIPMQLQS